MLTIKASDLAKLARVTLPICGGGSEAPALSAICIDAKGGRVEAWATDRYRIIGTRIPATAAADVTIALPSIAVKTLVSLYRPRRDLDAEIEFAPGDDGKLVRVTPSGSGWAVGETAIRAVTDWWAKGNPSMLDRIREIARNAVGNDADQVGELSVNIDLLAGFSAARNAFGEMRYRLHGPGKAIGVYSSDPDFIGAIMPLDIVLVDALPWVVAE